ncbi:MAG: ABC transporter permease subunit [Pseudomonadota bacterium]
MKPKFLIVFLKEVRETLRDRRALGLLALFVLMYPLLVGGILHDLIQRATKPEREHIEVLVIGADKMPTLIAQLKQRNINVSNSGPMDEAAIGALLRKRKIAAVLKAGDKFSEDYQAMRPAHIEMWFDSASDTEKKRRELDDALRDYRSGIVAARLLAHGVSPVTMAPVLVQHYDTGTSASRSAALIGTMLGMLFFPAFMICLSPAIDSTAGERERRSLEILLAQPASARDLIIGKWLAAAVLAIVGVSLELALAHTILIWLPLEEIGMSWQVTALGLAGVCVATIPLSLLAAGFNIALAMNAKSFKEAQSTAGFATVLAMLPMIIVPMLDLNTANWMYAVPLLSNQTLLRELSKGQDLGALPYVLTFASSFVLAAACVAFASWRMKSERYVLAV